MNNTVRIWRAFAATALMLVALFASTLISLAQEPGLGSSPATIATKLQITIKPLAERLLEAEGKLRNNELNDQELTALRAELDAISNDVLESVTRYQPEVSDVTAAFDRLPPPPAEGAPPEPEDIAAERKRLSDLRASTTLAMREAEALTVRSATLVAAVLERRRAQFVSSLLKRRDLDSRLFHETWERGPAESVAVWDTFAVWVRTTIQYKFLSLLAAFAATAVSGFVLYWVLRPLRRWIRRLEAAETITPLQRITQAFFSTVLPGFAFVVLALALHIFLGYFGLYRLRIDRMVLGLLVTVSGWVFVWLLLRAILSPGNQEKRLITMTDTAARRLFVLGLAMAVIYGLDYYTSQLITIFSLSVELTIVKTMLATLLIAGVLVAAVMTRLNLPKESRLRSGYRGWNPVMYWLVWISVIAIVMAAISGYVSLGRFMAAQIIISGSILATMYIGLLTSRAIAAAGALRSMNIGNRLYDGGMSDLRLDQLGLIASIIINGIILLIGVPILLLQWGFKGDDIGSWAASALTGFSVGGVQISFGRILLAFIVFFALIFATRVIQRWFEGKVLARTHLDSGVKDSMRAGVGYLGFFIAALVGISWAGFNLSNIALIAGALSVGIGFGLQNIVNNFVSGIIMLIERPIKVGDIIAVAGSEGFVRKINVRATELETFDRQSVIIPNSEVINTSVGNWMHTDSVRRILINVGVAYGSDTEKVRELLLECLEGDDRVATHPGPFVHFSDFGASSLDFQLRFFVRDIMTTPVVETDIRFAIDKKFRENGIEIPFPQRDIHIKSGNSSP